MPDLIAQGPVGEDRWRRELPDATSGSEIMLGRVGSDWNVPWDSLISRKHVRLIPMSDDRLEVHGMMTARNAVFHRGQQTDRFTLVPGDHFVIGKTTFTLVNRPGASESSAIGELTQHAYDHTALRKRNFRDAASRIEMLSRLPDLITSSISDQELLVRVTGVLLQATPDASAVAVVKADADAEGQYESSPVEVLHYDSRIVGRDGPTVSARLVRDAIVKRDSILHLWAGNRSSSAAFTASEEVDWAFCVPLRSDACPGWALYVTGGLAAEMHANLDRSIAAAPENLQDDVKFTELVGTTIANLRQSRRLQRRQAEMRHFFAPVVLEALADQDTDEVLEPREADLSVLFCDLRGFSRRSEEDAADMLSLLSHVSDALGVMTRHILDCRGVIGDFHGDAAMGFWGWPLDQEDAAARAVEAASRIRSDYRRGRGVAGFRCGIGVATGRAVAGRIGTVDQVKVTAFGPVVNLASRLENITKEFGVEVVLDQATANAIAKADEQRFRTRRLGKVRLAGLKEPFEILELLTTGVIESDASEGSDHPDPSDVHLTEIEIAAFESSLIAFEQGNWHDAYQLLHDVPAWDRPKDVLMSTILKHDRQPPKSWDGTVLGW